MLGTAQQPPATDDVERAISENPALADQRSASGTLALFSGWLGHPAWLTRRTTLEGLVGPLPEIILFRDELRIMANILDELGEDFVVAQLKQCPRPAIGSRNEMTHAYAPTLGDALSTSAYYISRHSPHLDVRLERGEGVCAIVFRPTLDLGRTGPFVAAVAAFWVFRSVDRFAQGRFDQMRVEFGYPAERWLEPLKASLPCEVTLQPGATRVVMPEAWVDLPNPFHDPALWQLALGRHEEFRLRIHDQGIVDRVRPVVATVLAEEHRAPRLAEVALFLAKSPRSLTRHLTRAGANFGEIVDQERRTLAARIIRDKARTLQDISEHLGFADRASFGRKFRGWFGTPPARYRQMGAGSSPELFRAPG